jgi:hypothetical protein
MAHHPSASVILDPRGFLRKKSYVHLSYHILFLS